MARLVLFPILPDLFHGKWLAMPRVNGFDVQAQQLFDADIGGCHIIHNRIESGLHAILEKVTAEQFAVSRQGSDRALGMTRDGQDASIESIFRQIGPIHDIPVQLKPIGFGESEYKRCDGSEKTIAVPAVIEHVAVGRHARIIRVHRDLRPELGSQKSGIANMIEISVGEENQLEIARATICACQFLFKDSPLVAHSSVNQQIASIALEQIAIDCAYFE